jgi:hypothetical protein
VLGNLEVATGIYVRLSNGDGTFQPPVIHVTPDVVFSLTVADLDGDKLPDVTTINIDGLTLESSISTLLNRNTTYVAAYLTTDVSTLFVAEGDLNDDGLPDLVTANEGTDNVSVVLSSPGGFLPTFNYPVGDRPTTVAITDLNGDGRSDLVAANSNNSSLSVLLGNGDGTFQSGMTAAAGTNPYCVAVGDVNDDNVPDLVAANHGNNNLSVLLGNGDGSFQPRVNFTTGNGPRFVSIGDLNGDGNFDLATANSTGSSISILLGNGDGSFQTRTDYSVGIDPRSVSIGDLNGDGVPDLAVANGSSNGVSILLGYGDGTFQAAAYQFVDGYPVSLAIGDLDGDYMPDLAVARFLRNQIAILRGNGDGTFAAPEFIGTGGRTYGICIADLNGDGGQDIATTNHQQGRVALFMGEPNRAKDFRDTVNSVITTPAIDSLIGDGSTAVATTAVPHLFRSAEPVTISGATPAAFNGTFFITVLSPTEFSYSCAASGTASGANKRATRPRESYPVMQWTLAGLSYLERTVGRVARAEQYLLPMNQTLSALATGVLANDIEPPAPISTSPCMTAVAISSPAPETFASFTPPDAAGHFSYTPPLNFQGTAKFQYRARADLVPNSNAFPACTTVSLLQDSVPVWISIVVLDGLDCAPTIDTPPLDTAYTQGGTASFLARASSPAGRLTFQWQRNAVDVQDRQSMSTDESSITGATGQLLTISNMQPSDQGSYTCIISSACGSIATAAASLGSPCSADFDGSGTVAVPDIFAFLSAWFAQDPSADFNRDSAISVPDIFAFLAAWFAGCP